MLPDKHGRQNDNHHQRRDHIGQTDSEKIQHVDADTENDYAAHAVSSVMTGGVITTLSAPAKITRSPW